MKQLKLNKESLTILNEKEMAQINGGLYFLSLWGSNCYNTNPAAHACCAPGTGTDPLCDQWSMEPPCDEMAWGDVADVNGELVYLDDIGNVISNPDFDAVTAPYFMVS